MGNQNCSTYTSLYSFYGNVSGESVQVFIEVPPGISKFGRVYKLSYVFNSPYIIPQFKWGKSVRSLPSPQIIDHAIDMSTNVDINPLRGLEDPNLYDEFDRWLAGDMIVDRRVQNPRSFFQVILAHALMWWLGDEVIFFSNFFECRGFVYYFYPLKSTCFYSSTTYSQVFSLD